MSTCRHLCPLRCLDRLSWLATDAASLKRSVRQVQRAGEKLLIHYSGQTAPIIDVATAEIRRTQIFVAALGAAYHTDVEATWRQQLPDGTSHGRWFELLGCIAALLV